MQVDHESIYDKPGGERVPLKKPEMVEGTEVYISAPEHILHLERGIIIARDHVQYRIKFFSLNEAIDGKCLWFPETIIDPVPKELKREPS
jgi:hypothetical protein